MRSVHYKNLQNGSDIRGVALEGVAGEPVTLTAEAAVHLSAGFLQWLSQKTGKEPGRLRIAVGHDSRRSAGALREILLRTFSVAGATVLDCGLASTPAMFFSTVFEEFRCDGSVMITASHLPWNRNGFKYFDTSGGLNRDDISQIISLAEDAAAHPDAAQEQTARHGPVLSADLMDVYCRTLRKLIIDGVDHPVDRNRPLYGLHIVVDAGNGAGGFYAQKVLAPLGADITGSQFLESDGNFPNHVPDPENPRAMAAIQKAVRENNADLGLIFDTDVDRSAAVDRHGQEISRNGIVALAAALVAEDHPGTTIVTDSITSDGLTRFLEKNLRLRHHRFKRGYKNVINESIRLNEEGFDSQLAIETSGHAAFKENHFLDDGAYLATRIVIKTARLALEEKTPDMLIAQLEHPMEAVELRFRILPEDFSAAGDAVLKRLENRAQQEADLTVVHPNYEGVRIAFSQGSGNGWCLLRQSLHDPFMPLNFESDDRGGARLIAARLLEMLEDCSELDLSALKDYCK